MTTICAVRYNQEIAIAGDGQVTAGEKTIMKASAHKVRRIFDDQVVIGFAGGVADAITLEDWLEKKLQSYAGNLKRAAIATARLASSCPTIYLFNSLTICLGVIGSAIIEPP